MTIPRHGAALLQATFLLACLAGESCGQAELRFIDPDIAGTSAAVVVPESLPLLHTKQLLPKNPRAPADEQIASLFDQLAGLLQNNASGLERVVKINFAAAHQDGVAAIHKGLAARFTGASRPAVSLVVGRLAVAGAVAALDGVAALPHDPALQQVKIAQGAAILPPGTRVWVSGQAEKGDLPTATRLTLEGLQRTLQHLKLKDTDIVQLKAFLAPITDVDVVHKEIAKFFRARPVPPVVTIEWKNNLPVEIELIAWGGRERAGAPLELLATPELKASPVFSRVARVNSGKLIYIAGLTPQQAAGSEPEIIEVFTRLGDILKKAGSDYRHLAKATYYVTDAATTKDMGRLRPRWYDPARPPAASLALTEGVGRAGKHVTIDMIAVPSP